MRLFAGRYGGRSSRGLSELAGGGTAVKIVERGHVDILSSADIGGADPAPLLPTPQCHVRDSAIATNSPRGSQAALVFIHRVRSK